MIKKAYLAGGCFWGLEDLMRSQAGVLDITAGYTGGAKENPTYESHTGHAEALEIEYDDTQTNFWKLLDFFFQIHNPTTLNQQGNDVGTAYVGFIVVAKVLGSIALVIPQVSKGVKEWAYAGFAFDFIAALISMYYVMGVSVFLAFPIIALLVLKASHYSYHKLNK